MFAAVAAGPEVGGYSSIEIAARRMAHLRDEAYEPIEANRRTYDLLYAEYVRLPRSVWARWRSCGEDTQAASQADSHGASSILAREARPLDRRASLASPPRRIGRSRELGISARYSIRSSSAVIGVTRSHSS